MRSIVFTLILLVPALADCQQMSRAGSVGVSVQRSSHFYTTYEGFPVNYKKYTRLASGSPYLIDAYMPAALVLADGKTYTDVRVKLNLADNEVQYLDSKGMELVARAPMKQLVISDTITRTDRHLLHSLALPPGTPREGWYELLADGKAGLYRLQERRLITEKPFNSASEEQRIDNKERFFVLVNNQFREIKKLKDLLELFPDKKADLESLSRKQKDQGSSWEQMLKALIRHYNETAGGSQPAV